MSAIRKLLMTGAVVGAVLIAFSQATLTVAAPMPKVGIAYQTSGGNGVGDANYTVIADMTVPAGKYHVTARGTVNNQTGVPVDYVACNAYGGGTPVDSGTTSAPMQYAGFAIDGVVDLPAGGIVRVECISSVAAAPLPSVGLTLIAESVAGISVLP